MSETLKYFNLTKLKSTKHQKYFEVYDELFQKYKNKKITFVEVGLLNGGSLEIWKNFFHPDSRIIGIDFNPECKKFEKQGYEIFIGDQSDENFWDSFFGKIGKIDVILDDGGHTNDQQIITTIKCAPFINDEGMIVIEDTHTSYQYEFGNPSKYSFINFSKKIIDDVNYTFPKLKKFQFSLNKLIYSTEFFESFVIFKVDRRRCKMNSELINLGEDLEHQDYRYENSKFYYLKKKFKWLKKIKIVNFIYSILLNYWKYFRNTSQNKKCKKYFY